MSRIGAKRLSVPTFSQVIGVAPIRRPTFLSRPFSNSAACSASGESQPIHTDTPASRSTRPQPAVQALGSSNRAPQSLSAGNQDVGGLMDLANMFDRNQAGRAAKNKERYDLDISRLSNINAFSTFQEDRLDEPHHFHVYASRQNTHITLTSPKRDVLVSLSAGNLGFKKAGRKSYDSAFQLAAFTIKKIQDRGLLPEIKKLEVSLRGYGAGREAVTKALLGTEGKLLRNKIVKVSDSTRLKFGGSRSPKPRRLG